MSSFHGELLHLVSFLLLLVLLSLESGGVAAADADEVGVEGDDDDGPGELTEDVVLLGVLDVALLGGAPAVVDGVTLVDPHEVDDNPGGDKGGGDNDHDAATAEVASRSNGVLAEPNDEERGGNVLRDQQKNVDEAVPPLNLVVQHKEELSRDADGGEGDSEDTDGRDTALDGDNAAAGDTFSGFGRAIADAAAALREDGGASLVLIERLPFLKLIGGEELVELSQRVHLIKKVVSFLL